jgi:hypothetical protein
MNPPGIGARSYHRILPFWSIPLLIAATIFLPTQTVSAAKYYYYIQVGSFRKEKSAVKYAQDLRDKGYVTVARGEQVADLGYWYRVYVGPFPSSQDAHMKIKELRKKGLIKSSVLYMEGNLIISNLGKRPEKIPPPVVKKAAPLAVVKKPVPEKTVEVKRPKEKVRAAEPVAAATAAAEAERAAKPSPEPAKAEQAPKKAKAVEEKDFKRGYGRNVEAKSFSLGWQHTYREIDTKLTERKRVTSDGTTTTTEIIPVTSDLENAFSTSMHMDFLLVKFGFTNWLEIFGKIGANYNEDDLGGVGPAYGGGLRWNIFEQKEGWARGFYTALQGEYLAGELEYDFTSAAGNKWKKEADWEEFSAKAELGIVRSRFAVYAGGSYLYYREDTDRTQLENVTPPLLSVKFEDDLEEKDSFGVFGGLSFYITPAFLINVEGQTINQDSISGLLEYRF